MLEQTAHVLQTQAVMGLTSRSLGFMEKKFKATFTPRHAAAATLCHQVSWALVGSYSEPSPYLSAVGGFREHTAVKGSNFHCALFFIFKNMVT